MKVVMVDDSATDRALCRLLLQEAHGPTLEFIEEKTAEEGLATCLRVRPDCILLDYRLPDMSGLEFLSSLQESSAAVVMLTGVPSEQAAVDAMKAGAQDYLVKDRITAESLVLSIQKAMERVALTRELEVERRRLIQSIEEKDLLLKEIHHRVKNNLQIIASLLRLQSASCSSELLTTALQASQNRVESMAMIHQQLYDSEDLRYVDLGEHAKRLLANLFHSFGVDESRVARQVKMEPLLVGIDQAIPVGLILNELVTNTLKHAFPGGRAGQVVIEGSRRGNEIRLVVGDDGIGIPDGVDLKQSKSLGLQIVHILARQLKSTLDITHEGGTVFHLSFAPR